MKFTEMGYPTTHNVPPPMRKLFDDIRSSNHSFGSGGQPYNPAGYPPNNQNW